MKGPTITINMDKPCAECGKGGAANSGICLQCTVKALDRRPMKSAAGKAVARRIQGSLPARKPHD
jgi:hypothetical protein